MSDTPRVDAMADTYLDAPEEYLVGIMQTLAQQLERELNEERARRQECERQILALQLAEVDVVAEFKVA